MPYVCTMYVQVEVHVRTNWPHCHNLMRYCDGGIEWWDDTPVLFILSLMKGMVE